MKNSGVIRLHLLAFSAVLLINLLASSNDAEAGNVRLRKFYLSPNQVFGQFVLQACVKGYHMASLWEILNPSNLKYEPKLGIQTGDSGLGPPAELQGWIRTGYFPDTTSMPGQGNCNSWDAGLANGTVVNLNSDWAAIETTGFAWEVATEDCLLDLNHVWCVED